MKFICESELMENQKHAEVMAPDVRFEVLQSSDGDALFFSIGSNHVFYVTREVTSSGTGWTKVDLSSPLSASHGGATVRAKTFAVAQNPQTLVFDLALVASIGGEDYLYLSLGHSGATDTWTERFSWTLVPFDAADTPAPRLLTIADVYLIRIPSKDHTSPGVESCFVDVLHSSTNPLRILDRYYIDITATHHWQPRNLSIDLSAGSVFSCLGKRLKDYVPGTYTFGAIANTTELIFTPQMNVFYPSHAPSPARLNLPVGATAIASALDRTGVTNLFVSATEGLYVFTSGNQEDDATPARIISSPIVGGASSLAAATVGSRTAVWGLNTQGTLFYAYCEAASEAVASAWSAPVPLVTGVEGFAFYLNINASNNVLFAHISDPDFSDRKLVQLTQDPVTATWSERSILLQTTNVDDIFEYNSFTTHIQVVNDNGINMPDTPVTLAAISPVSVYVNNTYHVLNPAVPLQVRSDPNGTITVIQETQSLAAVNLRVTMSGSATVFADINPMSKIVQKLSTIQTGEDLDNVQITTASGATRPLVPGSVSSEDRAYAAGLLSQLVEVSASLPADGSPVSEEFNSAFSGPAGVMSLLRAKADRGEQGALSATTLAETNVVVMAAGDLFQWISSKAGNFIHEVEMSILQGPNSYFLARIGKELYASLLNSFAAVLPAIEAVFKQIKVFFEDDLIPWLGFIFEWGDIIRTHNVLKNIFKQYSLHTISRFSDIEKGIKEVFTDLESKLNSWAEIPDSDDSQPMASIEDSASSNAPSGTYSPQSNWALYHTKGNLISSNTPYRAPFTDTDTFDELIRDLVTLATDEWNDIQASADQVKSQIVDEFSTLSPVQVAKKLLAILGDLLLNTAENVLVALVKVLKAFLNGIVELLDAPINIPIISSIYRKITGNDLSFLDLMCLIAAIPATIVYKLTSGEAPYPDDSSTRALIEARDFTSIVKLLSPNTESSLGPRSTSSTAGESDAEIARTAIASISPNIGRNTNIVFNLVPIFGAFALTWFNLEKRLAGTKVHWGYRYASITAFVVYIAPDISGAWMTPGTGPGTGPTVMNDVITAIAFVKTVVDNMPGPYNHVRWNNDTSPFVESFINTCWLIPDIGALVGSSQPGLPSEILSFASNAVFDISGMLTVPSTPLGPTGDIFWILKEGLSFTYGVLQVGIYEALMAGK